TGILNAGVLPADKGVRPHLTVTVPADVFGAAAAAGQGQPASESNPDAGDPFAPVAHLEGYGPIGPALVGYLACLGQVTVVTTAGAAPDSGVLNVGRTRRLQPAGRREPPPHLVVRRRTYRPRQPHRPLRALPPPRPPRQTHHHHTRTRVNHRTRDAVRAGAGTSAPTAHAEAAQPRTRPRHPRTPLPVHHPPWRPRPPPRRLRTADRPQPPQAGVSRRRYSARYAIRIAPSDGVRRERAGEV